MDQNIAAAIAETVADLQQKLQKLTVDDITEMSIRFFNQAQTSEDVQTLFNLIFTSIFSDINSQRKLEYNIANKRQNKFYQQEVNDPEDIDDAILDSTLEEVDAQCDAWGIIYTQLSDDIAAELVNTLYPYIVELTKN